MKVLVIGGGLAGVQSAYFLLRDGHDVTLVERNQAMAMETSFANGGLLTPSHAAPWNSPGIFSTLLKSVGKKDASIHVKLSALGQYLGWGRQFVRNSTRKRYYRTIERNFALARYSQKCLHGLLDEVPLDFFHARKGSMMVYSDASGFADARGRFNELARQGVKAQLCNGEDLAQIEPSLAPRQNSLAGGVYFEEDEHGDAREFTQGLADYIIEKGVKILTGISVADFVTRGKSVVGVRTDQGEMTADAIVLAAGHWSVDLLNGIGVHLPVRPVKGSSLTYDLPKWKDGPKTPVVDDELHVAVTPLGTRFRIVGTAEFCGYDPIVRPERMALLRRAGLAMFPQLEAEIDGVKPTLQWSGHRPMTPDCMPVLGKCGFDNLYLNTGHGYLGWTTGTGTAKAVADLINGRKPTLDLANYGLNRF